MNTEIKNVPEAFRNASVNVKIEVTSDINITSFVARQNVNVFLLGHIGNLVSAGEPTLLIAEDRLRWKVPICCAVPHKGMRAIGDIAVDVNTGEVLLSESAPSDLDLLRNAVESAYASTECASPSAGNR